MEPGAALSFAALRHPTVFFAVALMAVIVMMVLPMPAFVLDMGLATSFALAILIFTVTLFIQRPLDFSAFPTVLLASLMLRLSLNVSSTKLIIGQGHTGTDAAGSVIEGFAMFVMGGDVYLGLVVFGVLLIVNFIVITKGAGRMAEVGARFALDGMPGKQLAIDSDMAAGAISHEEARARRKTEQEETTFFGSLDGASKFVKGDAVAGLLITLLNLLIGVAMGVGAHGMAVGQAFETYAILTVGDGLVNQIPAVIISIASALLLSKGGVLGSADQALTAQLGNYPVALATVAGLMALFAFVPGLPFIPFMIGAGALGGAAWLAERDRRAKAHRPPAPRTDTAPPRKTLGDMLDLDEIHVQFAPDLVETVMDPATGLDARIQPGGGVHHRLHQIGGELDVDLVEVEHVAQRLARRRRVGPRGGRAVRLCAAVALRQPRRAAQRARPDHERDERQAGHEGEQRHQPRHRRQRHRIVAKLRGQRLIGGAEHAALGQKQRRGDRDDHGGDLVHQPVAHGQDRVGLERLADRHAVRADAHRHADQQVQQRDQQPRHRVALDELGGAVERAEERGLLLLGLAAGARLLMADRARRHVAVDGELLAGHPVEREARADLGHAAGALGDDDEIHDQQHAEHHEAQIDVAAHHEHREALDHRASRVGAGVALADDQLGGGDVERQPQHQRGQQHGGKRGKVQRALDEQRHGEDQDRQRERRRQPHVQHEGRHRQHHHHDHRHQRDGEEHRRVTQGGEGEGGAGLHGASRSADGRRAAAARRRR